MSAAAKDALRAAALERRAAISPEMREAFAGRLALKGVEIARQAIARTVAAYWPMREEADTRYLLQALAYHEFAAALPVVQGRGLPLIFRKWSSRDPPVPGSFGVMEPSRRLPEARPDILFVPLAAFDRRGHRIGYGAGYYDLTLRELRGMKKILAIGVAFATQEIDDVPDESHDQRLDFVMTEDELIDCRMD